MKTITLSQVLQITLCFSLGSLAVLVWGEPQSSLLIWASLLAGAWTIYLWGRAT